MRKRQSGVLCVCRSIEMSADKEQTEGEEEGQKCCRCVSPGRMSRRDFS